MKNGKWKIENGNASKSLPAAYFLATTSVALYSFG
jgi:hypothetical protein